MEDLKQAFADELIRLYIKVEKREPNRAFAGTETYHIGYSDWYVSRGKYIQGISFTVDFDDISLTFVKGEIEITGTFERLNNIYWTKWIEDLKKEVNS